MDLNKSDISTNEILKDRIIKDLKEMGVKKGDHISVALSFKSIGHMNGGPESFIDALLDVVGKNGTIMMNTYTLGLSRLSKINSGKVSYVFDSKSTPCNTGIVPEKLRKRKGAIRSKHPNNSVTAIGKFAKYLTENHDAKSSAYLPYSRLAKINGKSLFIGIGDDLVAIRHEAQHLAGLVNILPPRAGVKYLDENGEIKLFVREDAGGCIKKLPELVPIIRRMGIIKDGKVGLANAILAPTKETLESMADLLKKDPTTNLCDDITCLWCRELERKMNLYEDIESPKFFQKNLLVIKTIEFINKFRLRTT